MIDPRQAAVERRLSRVARVLPVTGGKGGIGKSLVSVLLALSAARNGRAVGLLDLDLTGPCGHLLLGVEGGFPTEGFGVDPAVRAGVRFLSVSAFAGSTPAPLRGVDCTNALLELLAIARWDRLDALILDMPPGIGDVTLDTLRWIPRAEFVAVTTPSRVVRETVRRTLTLLTGLRRPVAGLVENMGRGAPGASEALAADAGVPFLGTIPFDGALEAATGDPDALLASDAGEATRRVASALGLGRGPGEA